MSNNDNKYSFESLNKELEELTARLERWNEISHNKKIGYSPKCKVCTSPQLDKIEELREKGYSLNDIKEELNLDLSLMSLSRHFKNHYPKNQRYKLKQRITFMENIQAAYINFPFLEDYFKDKPLEYLERFNNECGFCTDKFSLCPRLDKGVVCNSEDYINFINRELAKDIQKLTGEFYYPMNSDKIREIKYNAIILQNRCITCKNNINSDRLDLLEKIIIYNFLNIPTDNRETYFKLLNFHGDKNDFFKSLEDIKGES